MYTGTKQINNLRLIVFVHDRADYSVLMFLKFKPIGPLPCPYFSYAELKACRIGPTYSMDL